MKSLLRLFSLLAASSLSASPAATPEGIRITTVYDNTALSKDLESDWGFAAIVEQPGTTLLFDTGAKGDLLLSNLERLGFKPSEIDVVVLSHAHYDHTGGVAAIIDAGGNPRVYLLSSFPEDIATDLEGRTEIVRLTESQTIAPGISSIIVALDQPIGDVTMEQSLLLPTGDGLILMAGCAHPGIVEIAEASLSFARAQGLTNGQSNHLELVMGGFHLFRHNEEQVDQIVEQLRSMGVRKTMPSHCTGDNAIDRFKLLLGDDCLTGGVGSQIEFPIEL